jgi:hypothetical protein
MLASELFCMLKRGYQKYIQEKISCDNPAYPIPNGRLGIGTFFSHRWGEVANLTMRQLQIIE